MAFSTSTCNIPGKPAACNHGLPSMNSGQLEDIPAPLPFEIPHIPSNRDQKALNRGRFGGCLSFWATRFFRSSGSHIARSPFGLCLTRQVSRAREASQEGPRGLLGAKGKPVVGSLKKRYCTGLNILLPRLWSHLDHIDT